MELALTITAVLGGLLFIYSYLKFVFSGFRYHVITGFLAMIPVVNLVTMPTLLDNKLMRTLIFGVVGLVLAVGAWFLGADKTLHKHIATLRGQPMMSAPQVAGTSASAIQTTPAASSGDGQVANGANTTAAEGSGEVMQQAVMTKPVYLEELPKKALYNMEFVETSVDQIGSLMGRIVRVITSDDVVTEGRVQNVAAGSLFLQRNGDGKVAYEMLTGNIKHLRVLVKR